MIKFEVSLCSCTLHFFCGRKSHCLCFRIIQISGLNQWIALTLQKQLKIYINAKHLLKTTDLSIEDISHQTGFSDSVYFIRVFKKIEGITPSRFRKM
ncbi:MAG: AraC family transcriptional regulator [Lachnospiraceae bacterium]|nr:AraC family transcriptional regulator [Lachnospiraceae bacterium]